MDTILLIRAFSARMWKIILEQNMLWRPACGLEKGTSVAYAQDKMGGAYMMNSGAKVCFTQLSENVNGLVPISRLLAQSSAGPNLQRMSLLKISKIFANITQLYERT